MRHVIKYLKFLYHGHMAKFIVLEMCFFFVIMIRDFINLFFTKNIYDTLGKKDLSELFKTSIMYLIILFLYVILLTINNIYSDPMQSLMAVNNQIKMIDKYHNGPNDLYKKNYTNGDLMQRFWDKLITSSDIITNIIKYSNFIIMFVVFLIVFIDISFHLIYVFVFLIITNIIILFLRYTTNQNHEKKINTIQSNIYTEKHELINSIDFFVINNMFQRKIKQYHKLRLDMYKENIKMQYLNIFFSFIDFIIESISKLIICYIITREYHLFAAGSIVITFNIASQLKGIITSIRNITSDMPLYVESIKMLDELMVLSDSKKFESISTDTDTIFKLHKIKFSYDDILIINNINLLIKANEKIAIIGKNGTGKTTLLKIMIGELSPKEGYCNLYTSNSYHLDRENKASYVSYIPADDYFFIDTVKENLLMSTDISEDFEEIMNELVEKNIGTKMIYELSAGQRQRVNMIRAYSKNSKLVIADEPTASLDNAIGTKLIKMLIKRKNTLVVTTHNPDILKYFERIIILDNHSIVFDGTYNNIKTDPYYKDWCGTLYSKEQ